MHASLHSSSHFLYLAHDSLAEPPPSILSLVHLLLLSPILSGLYQIIRHEHRQFYPCLLVRPFGVSVESGIHCIRIIPNSESDERQCIDGVEEHGAIEQERGEEGGVSENAAINSGHQDSSCGGTEEVESRGKNGNQETAEDEANACGDGHENESMGTNRAENETKSNMIYSQRPEHHPVQRSLIETRPLSRMHSSDGGLRIALKAKICTQDDAPSLPDVVSNLQAQADAGIVCSWSHVSSFCCKQLLFLFQIAPLPILNSSFFCST